MIELVQPMLAGDRRALARLLTVVENGRPGVDQVIADLFPHTGRAWVIGITGAPGTGKSSLVNALAKAYRADDKTVGILAVDPTSPFTGGAILGDRIRMRDLTGDKGIFIRSMATRGSLGGLARPTRDAIRLMDAAGFDIVVVETVGAGQSEVDIVRTAQTTVVVEAPGMGDDVQAIKAGILEIADVLVVNKADKQGVDNTIRGLKNMLELGHPTSRDGLASHHGQLLPVEAASSNGHRADFWLPPIVRTVATDGLGIDEVKAAIQAHRDYLAGGNRLAHFERQTIEIELHDRLRITLMDRLLGTVSSEAINTIISRIQAREIDPQTAMVQILDLYDQAQVKVQS